MKFSPRYFGPYQISERINLVTYRLELPEDARIHNAFHVSKLKKHRGIPPTTALPIPMIDDGIAIPEPELMLRNRVISGRLQVLIKWKNQPSIESSWEDAKTFQKLYPKFQLEDELILQVGGDVIPDRRTTRSITRSCQGG